MDIMASQTRSGRRRENFLVFGSPLVEDAEIDEVVACLRSGWIGTGPKVAQFEDDFRRFKSAKHAVALGSCTAALQLSMIAAGLQPGDEVITTPMTFCATINAIIHAGATPVLVDINPRTMNIDPEGIEKAVTSKTRALLPVHFAGRPCEMDTIMTIADRHGLKVIEDCAHAIEAEFKGTKTGTFGDFGCFSFYVTKNIVTGEGGMVLTSSEDAASRIKILALHGMSRDAWKRFGDEGFKHYYVTECGYKSNMMDIQAAIGLHQLKRVETYWARRQAIWQRYDNAFKDVPVVLPKEPEPNTRHARHLYTILIEKEKTGLYRDDFLEAMTRENIGVGVHYLSIPEHPYYQQRFGWKPEDYPKAMWVGRQTVSLPLSAKLTDDDVEDVIGAVHKIISRKIKKS
jgi:dTDP-4-amino-4,6-dideoxygalactose transaminase